MIQDIILYALDNAVVVHNHICYVSNPMLYFELFLFS